MGSRRRQTVGYHYRWAWWFGWCDAADALLELRASDKPMWGGRLTGNGTIGVDSPGLFGGEDSGGQGGVQGEIDVLFGAADQAPSAYAIATFGAKQSGMRGKFSTLFKGGRFGAFSPNPQPVAAKVERILTDWPDDTPWYAEKAVIVLPPSGEPPAAAAVLAWSQARFSTQSDQATMGLQFYDAAETLLGEQFAPMLTATAVAPAWQARSLSVTAPAGTRRVRVFMRMHRINGTNNDGYIRDIQLTLHRCPQPIINPSADEGTSGWSTEYGGPLSVTGYGAFYGGESEDSSFYQDVTVEYGTRAMNPAHIIYESLTSPKMQHEPVGLINEASFQAAADQLHAEGFGLCTRYASSAQTPAEFRQRICDVINAYCTQSKLDGQYYLDLVRAAADLESLPVITSDDIVKFRQTPNVIAQATNIMQCEWMDRVTKTVRTTQPVYSPSAIRSAGRSRQATSTYPEIGQEELALRVIQRDLNVQTLPSSTFELVCLRRWRGLRPGQNVRLQVPEEGIADMVCSVIKIDHGQLTDGQLTLTAVQNVFGLPATVTTAASPGEWVVPSTDPESSPRQRALEMPYIDVYARLTATELAALSSDAGYLLTAATRAAAGESYVVASHAAGGDYEEAVGLNDWCPAAILTEAAGYLTQNFTFTQGLDLGRVSVGDWGLLGDELVRLDALDIGAGSLSLGRGCADTVPAEHPAGSVLYLLGAWGGTDNQVYAGGDVVSVKLLTKTSAAVQDLDAAAELTVTMDDRLGRPYSPGKLRIAATAYPTAVTGQFDVTWAHRNRLDQADLIVDTEAEAITPATNTRYGLRFLDAADNELVIRTDIGPGTATVTLNYTGDVTLELWTIDDAGESWQRHRHSFGYTPPGGSPTNTITATAYSPVFNGTIIDGGSA